MATKTIAELKSKFETGDTPTGQDFIDLVDSFLHESGSNFPNPLPAVSGAALTGIPIANPLPALDGAALYNINPSEWTVVPGTANFASASSFVMAGDKRQAFKPVRRLRLKIAGAYVYTEVLTASYAAGTDITTVTTFDAVVASGLTEAAHSVFTPANADGAISATMVGALTAGWLPSETNPPSMAVRVAAGAIDHPNGGQTKSSAQTTGVLVAPGANPRNDLVVIDNNNGQISVIAGTEAAVPADPGIPSSRSRVMRVRLRVGMTVITNSDIDDLRAYARTDETHTFKTIGDLRVAQPLSAGLRAAVLGYYVAGDGGDGVFRWDSASTSADNGGTIIRPDSVIATDPGRWMRIFSGMLNIRWFGAKTDGTSVSAAVQAAVNAAFALGQNVYAPQGDYAYRDTMFMRSNVHMYGDGEKTYFYPVTGLNLVLGDGIFTTFAAVSRYYATQATHPVTVALRGDYASYVGPHTNIGLHNMRIKGTRQTASGDGACTIEFMDFVGADINTCVVEDGHDVGIRIEGAGDVNPVWTDFDTYTGGFALDWRISNCKISNSKHAIEIGEQATRGWILDNKCVNNLQHGIRLTGGYTVQIRGNRVLATTNTFNDIQLSQSQDLVITGNHLDPLTGNATVEEAIRVLQIRRVQIFGNEITKGGVIYNSSLVSENVRVWGNQYHNGTSRAPAELVQLPNGIAPFVRERVPTNNAMTAFIDLAVGGVLAVRAYRSANVTLLGGALDRQVIFDAEEYDQGGRYDPATGRLSALSGAIECLMGIRLDTLNLTAGDVIVAKAKTAGGVALSQVPFRVDDVALAWFVAPLTFKAADGENVEFFINISGAATDRTLLAGQTTTWLSARMIGGV